MKFLLVLGVFAFFALFASSQAFECYQCEYYQNDTATDAQVGCNADKISDEFLVNCTQPGYEGVTWQCSKKNGKTIDEDDNEFNYVKRFCSPGTLYETTCKESDALGSPYGTVEKGSLCYCAGERCNGSGQIQVGIFATIISLIVIALRYQN